MKQARYKEPLPLAVIKAARAGDAGAVEQVLQYYNGYINKLCTRTLYDDCGQLHTSIFYDMGYTVSQTAGLSAAQRQRILKCAIDTGKASKYDVMKFLRQRMNINGMKAGNEIAFQKWKEDYDFIRSL